MSLCYNISIAMYKKGRENKTDNTPLAQKEKKKKLGGLRGDDKRDNIDFKLFSKGQITIDAAYQKNKDYNHKVSEKLMEVRQRAWKWQYWLLIISMILMYPSPIILDILAKQ